RPRRHRSRSIPQWNDGTLVQGALASTRKRTCELPRNQVALIAARTEVAAGLHLTDLLLRLQTSIIPFPLGLAFPACAETRTRCGRHIAADELVAIVGRRRRRSGSRRRSSSSGRGGLRGIFGHRAGTHDDQAGSRDKQKSKFAHFVTP